MARFSTVRTALSANTSGLVRGPRNRSLTLSTSGKADRDTEGGLKEFLAPPALTALEVEMFATLAAALSTCMRSADRLGLTGGRILSTVGLTLRQSTPYNFCTVA